MRVVDAVLNRIDVIPRRASLGGQHTGLGERTALVFGALRLITIVKIYT